MPINKNKKSMGKRSSPKLLQKISQKTAEIGNTDAINDKDYLESCFIETSVFSDLMDDHNTRSLLVGRTGAGKTACLQRIVQLSSDKNMKYVEIDVEHEFLGYLKNLMWLKKLEESGGYNFTPLFKNLWKHIIIANLIKAEFPSQKNFLEKFTKPFSKKKKDIAELRRYLDEYGGDFWETQHTLEKIVQVSEKEISAKMQFGEVGGGGSFKQAVTKESTTSAPEVQDAITNRKLVADLQKAIADVNKYLRTEVGRVYYVLIDQLDEEWIDERFRYPLIRALIEAIRYFYSDKKGDGHSIKVVVALRRDLLDKVYESTQGVGFQSEKYRAFEAELCWDPKELRVLIEKRINHMYENKYTQRPVQFHDIFPPKHERVQTMKYILDRTLLRPRDIIAFVNYCLKEWKHNKLTKSAISRAERAYSEDRYISIMDEWRAFYPYLKSYAEILTHKEFQQSGSMNFIDWRAQMEEAVIGTDAEGDPHNARWVDMIGNSKDHEVAVEFLQILYRVGLVLIKSNPAKGFEAYPVPITSEQYKRELLIKIHPMFHGKFGINPKAHEQGD